MPQAMPWTIWTWLWNGKGAAGGSPPRPYITICNFRYTLDFFFPNLSIPVDEFSFREYD